MNRLTRILFSFLISLFLIAVTFVIEMFIYKQEFLEAAIFSSVGFFPFVILFLDNLFGNITKKEFELNKYFMIKNGLLVCVCIFLGIITKNHLCIVGASFGIQGILGHYAGLFCRKDDIKNE